MVWRPNNKVRRVAATANIPAGKTWDDFPLDKLVQLLRPDYLIGGKEKAGTTGQLHYQMYFEFKKQKLSQTVMNQFSTWGIKAHLEVAMGTCEENQEYCSKEDEEPFVHGEPTGNNGQGSRTDLGTLFQAVKDGVSGVDLAEIDPGKWAVHRKALEEYRTLLAPKRAWPSKLVFLWGPTGHGKTAHAMELEPETVHYREPFMVGFTARSENVLFDDFNWKKMDVKFWLTLCDRYPMTVDIKGDTRNWAPKIIIFTSNDDPKTWWPDAPPETLKAVHRRMEEFGTIKCLGEPVPVGQRMLTEFLNVASSAAEESTVAAAPLTVAQAANSLLTLSEVPTGPDPEVVDLTQDESDSDGSMYFDAEIDSDREWDAHSEHSNEGYRRAWKRARKTLPGANAQRCIDCEMKIHLCQCD